MEVTNQAATIPVQAPSAMPTASVPSSVAPSGMSQSSQYQASVMSPQQAAPQAPVYQQAPAQQASAAQGNPWQEAFQALSANLNTSNPYQGQGAYSAYQTPTPQASIQAPLASMAQQAPQWGSQAQQTYSPQVSTQGYSEAEVAQLINQAQQQVVNQHQQQGASQVSDGYLSQVSDESLEVLQHFGAEAPSLLNNYACAVEDALIEQVQRGQSTNLLLEAVGEERAAMNLMLTHPDVLADYVNGFFGPDGPYPTPTAEEQAVMNNEVSRQQFAQEIAEQEARQVPQNFQRPQMQMPTPGRAQAKANDFWGGLSDLMDASPENAWQYLSQAPQGALQSKLLVQDT